MENNSSFFCNKECKYFPCHETKDPDSFNCLFCYCPLYFYGDRCGGHFKITAKGVKSCINCTIPHHPNSAEYINAKLKELNTGKPDQRAQLMVCLDLEGTIFPEIWEAVAKETGEEGFMKTTRDVPSYDALMKLRLELAEKHGLKLEKIISVIEKMEPLPGALDFVQKLKEFAHVMVVSDTFEQFAAPVEKKFGLNVICNTLITDEDGNLTGYKMRCRDTKVTAVKAFQSMGYRVFAAGDGYNDVGMIKAADMGCLVNAPISLAEDNKNIKSVKSLAELYKIINEDFR